MNNRASFSLLRSRSLSRHATLLRTWGEALRERDKERLRRRLNDARVLFKADISSPNADTVINFHSENYKFRSKLCFDQKQNNFTGCCLSHGLFEDCTQPRN